MTQVTWRAPDDLVENARQAANRQGWSLNDYLTRLVRAATDPELAGSEVDRLRERLALVGLLTPVGPPRRRPDAAAVAAARRQAGQGTPLSDLVAEERA